MSQCKLLIVIHWSSHNCCCNFSFSLSCGPSIRSSELLNSNSKWDQIGKSFYSAEFGPRSKPRRFGIDPNRDHSKLNPHEPPVFLKPGETPDDFEVVCYKLHFIRINNLGYRLKLAALYSQATIGPNTNPDPPKDDHYEHSYWTAWKQLGNMSKVHLFTFFSL